MIAKHTVKNIENEWFWLRRCVYFIIYMSVFIADETFGALNLKPILL